MTFNEALQAIAVAASKHSAGFPPNGDLRAVYDEVVMRREIVTAVADAFEALVLTTVNDIADNVGPIDGNPHAAIFEAIAEISDMLKGAEIYTRETLYLEHGK